MKGERGLEAVSWRIMKGLVKNLLPAGRSEAGSGDE